MEGLVSVLGWFLALSMLGTPFRGACTPSSSQKLETSTESAWGPIRPSPATRKHQALAERMVHMHRGQMSGWVLTSWIDFEPPPRKGLLRWQPASCLLQSRRFSEATLTAQWCSVWGLKRHRRYHLCDDDKEAQAVQPRDLRTAVGKLHHDHGCLSHRYRCLSPKPPMFLEYVFFFWF